jgi:hypothetical protein
VAPGVSRNSSRRAWSRIDSHWRDGRPSRDAPAICGDANPKRRASATLLTGGKAFERHDDVLDLPALASEIYKRLVDIHALNLFRSGFAGVRLDLVEQSSSRGLG